ncbi:MAG: cell wall hydrolase [Lachnospiraceae bacterium]|jgi:spore germination cell wall hydrolase CwlJ-like protein|nr:cell wall hydrolase [Lachnospiraceae bacterium]
MVDNNNNNSLKNSIIFALFLVVMIAFTTLSVHISKADENSTISSLQSQVQNASENQSSESEKASELEESKSEMESIVGELSTELESLNQDISDLESKIQDKNTEIETKQVELESAQAKEAEQYDDMKLRIQFMYEMGDNSFLDVLSDGGSFAASLSKLEYIGDVVSYDRKMLDEYKDTKEKVETEELELESQKTELESLKTEQEDKQTELSAKVDDANNQILKLTTDIDAANKAIEEYELQIEAANEAIFEEYQRQEQESIRLAMESEAASIAAAKAAGTYDEETATTSISTYEPVGNDVDKLAALIECEAANQPYLGKLAVGAVVVNRVANPRFPNTLTGVIYQPYQFTPVLSGRFSVVFARGANAECYKAAREVLEEGHIVGNWIYFRTINGHPGDIIGDHVFYYIY